MFEGALIGGYRVLHAIGEGGMGTVWVAEHSMLGRRAAIKILQPSYSQREDIVTRFFNEARAATAISDPGIIQIFDFGYHTDGNAFIVMELLEGEPLDQRLRRQGALPVAEALRLARQIASSVGAAHARGIIHRDLKPENVFVVRDPEVAGGERTKVLDFGIAKLGGDGGGNRTHTSAIIGTPLYMSPEQCRGAGQVDQRADVYSLGCVLFALVTGNAPFSAEGTGELIVQHLTEAPPRPSTRSLGLPPEVDELILRCLAKDPAQRFASGTELAQAIDALLSRPSVSRASQLPATVIAPARTTLASAVGSAVSSSPAATPAPRSGRGWMYAGAAVVVVAGAAIAIVVVSAAKGRVPAEPPVVEAPTPPPPKPPPPVPPPPPVDPKPAQARADIQVLLGAFTAWGASHAGAPCPAALELDPRSDPWGHPYELTCADQPADQIAGVRSNGPDGARGTEDDLTSWTMGREVTELAHGARWVVAAAAPPKRPPPVAAKRPKKDPKKPEKAKPDPGIIDLDGDGIPDVR